MEGVKDLLEAPDFGTKRHLSRGKLRRSFMGNTREQEFLQAQQHVPRLEIRSQLSDQNCWHHFMALFAKKTTEAPLTQMHVGASSAPLSHDFSTKILTIVFLPSVVVLCRALSNTNWTY